MAKKKPATPAQPAAGKPVAKPGVKGGVPVKNGMTDDELEEKYVWSKGQMQYTPPPE